MTETADPLGAFVRGPFIELAPSGLGSLDSLSFAVKDLIDVAGAVTGGGNPDWAAAQSPARTSAPVVRQLLAAGARLRGKTVTDELAFSLEGANAHHGTPLNPRAPGRLPGGSSSGSAAALAGGVVDFALGTDTGGSVRIPASFCGLYGLRPTHGAISLEGVIPFAPSYDTIGLMARDASLLARLGAVLLPEPGDVPPAPRFLIAEDALALAQPAVVDALRAALPEVLRAAAPVRVFADASGDWLAAYRVLQGWEIWQALGPWIESHVPRFGPSIAERFADAATITIEDAARWRPWRETVRRRLDAILGVDGILILPTAPSPAPMRNAASDEIASFYRAALTLTSIAGHAGLPQLTLPLALVDDAPVGISLVARRGADRHLLALAEEFCRSRDVARH